MSYYDNKFLPDSYLFDAHSSLGGNMLRKFKRGQCQPEATLDLHGCRIFEAEEAFDHFMQESLAENLRVLLIIHGKGAQAILKNQVNDWLKEHSQVLAFCSAKPKDGGLGAVYVLLKKQAIIGDKDDDEDEKE